MGRGSLQPPDGFDAGIVQLTYARSLEQSKGGVPAQAVVDGQLRRHSPGVHGVRAQSLNILRKAAVAGRSGFGLTVGAIKWGQTVQFRRELTRVGQVEGRVLSKDVECLRLTRKRTAQYRFVDEVDAKLGGMLTGRTTDIVAKLAFLLVANYRECGDAGNKLVVAITFSIFTRTCG